MPRNGSGTFSVTNSFSSGTTIASADVNSNFTDVGAEITNSLPRDGQAAMTGQFKASNGTASAPAITFSADSDTGFYRAGANTVGVSANGSRIAEIGPNGISDVHGNAMTAFPAGTKMLFLQADAPVGWTKDTTHNNKALRIVSGAGGGSGGSTAFTDVFAARTIVQANLPAVNLSSGSLSASSSATASSVGTNGVTNGNWNVGAGSSRTVQQLIKNGGSLDNFSIDVSVSTSVSGVVPLGGSNTPMNFAVAYVDAIICTKD